MDAAFFASGLAPSDDDLVVGVVEDAGPAYFMAGLEIFSWWEFAGEFLAVADDSRLLVSSFDDGVLPSAAPAWKLAWFHSKISYYFKNHTEDQKPQTNKISLFSKHDEYDL